MKPFKINEHSVESEKRKSRKVLKTKSMKNLKLISSFFLITLVTITSCDKEKDKDENPDEVEPDVITAQIDLAEFYGFDDNAVHFEEDAKDPSDY